MLVDLDVGTLAIICLDKSPSAVLAVLERNDGLEVDRPLELRQQQISITLVIEAVWNFQVLPNVKEGTPVAEDASVRGHPSRRSMDAQRGCSACSIDCRILGVELEPQSHVKGRLDKFCDQLSHYSHKGRSISTEHFSERLNDVTPVQLLNNLPVNCQCLQANQCLVDLVLVLVVGTNQIHKPVKTQIFFFIGSLLEQGFWLRLWIRLYDLIQVNCTELPSDASRWRYLVTLGYIDLLKSQLSGNLNKEGAENHLVLQVK